MSALTLHQPEVATPIEVAPEANLLSVRLTTPYVNVRVGTATEFVGEIELEEIDGRWVVRRHARRILPRDVVLKVLVQFSRHEETFGKLIGRDGRAYFWHVGSAQGEDMDADELDAGVA